MAYYKAVVGEANKQFEKMWEFDKLWVDLLGVAHDLDKTKHNTVKTDEINSFVANTFKERMEVSTCAAFLTTKHLTNQRGLEAIMHSSQR